MAADELSDELPRPKRKKRDVPNTTGQQKFLITGLDCEPNQLELFDTSGYTADTHTHTLGDSETSGKRR